MVLLQSDVCLRMPMAAVAVICPNAYVEAVDFRKDKFVEKIVFHTLIILDDWFNEPVGQFVNWYNVPVQSSFHSSPNFLVFFSV